MDVALEDGMMAVVGAEEQQPRCQMDQGEEAGTRARGGGGDTTRDNGDVHSIRISLGPDVTLAALGVSASDREKEQLAVRVPAGSVISWP